MAVDVEYEARGREEMSIRKVLWWLVNLPLLPFYAVIAVLLGGVWVVAWLDPKNWSRQWNQNYHVATRDAMKRNGYDDLVPLSQPQNWPNASDLTCERVTKTLYIDGQRIGVIKEVEEK